MEVQTVWCCCLWILAHGLNCGNILIQTLCFNILYPSFEALNSRERLVPAAVECRCLTHSSSLLSLNQVLSNQFYKFCLPDVMIVVSLGTSCLTLSYFIYHVYYRHIWSGSLMKKSGTARVYIYLRPDMLYY